MSDGGKGSGSRPMEVPREDYEASFDRIFGKRERKEYVPPPLPGSGCIKCPRDPNKPCWYCMANAAWDDREQKDTPGRK